MNMHNLNTNNYKIITSHVFIICLIQEIKLNQERIN